MRHTTTTPDASLLAEMRGYLADCAWADMEPAEFEDPDEPNYPSDDEVCRVIERIYEGGVAQFINDQES